jgi:hypothetical protein
MCDCIEQMNAELAKKNTQLNVVFSMATGKTLGVAVDVGPIEKKARIPPAAHYCGILSVLR